MPALVTHHIFGEDVAAELPVGLVDGEEGLLAFLLGSQGPDPFFARFSTLPGVVAACHGFARTMQGSRPLAGLIALRDGVLSLPAADEAVGRAFALGVLAHYALDRAVHPFVISQQEALAAVDPSLAESSREVHGLIEADLDSWLLWEKRRATVAERPSGENLMRTERIERVGGALFSHAALSAFGVSLGATEYAGCVRDYEWLYGQIEPAGTEKYWRIVAAETRLRGRSLAAAMAHPLWEEGRECAAANLERRPWAHPFTGEVCRDSFADLFDETLHDYPRLAEAFVAGDDAHLAALVDGLNYEGRRVGEDEL